MTDLQTGPGPGSGAAAPELSPEEEHERKLEARLERAAARGPKTTRVVAARVSLRARIVELWRSRELFIFLARKDIKVKYKNSVLGFLWSMLNPALTLIVYFLVFKVVLKNGVPQFAIYLFSGLLVWNLFQTAIIGATSAVVSNGGIVKKVSFPREILALSTVGSSTVFFFFQALVMVLFLVVLQHSPAWGQMWLLVPALVALLVFTSALAVFLSAVNVYFRDVEHLVQVMLMVWFWAIPIVYVFHQVQSGLQRHHLFWIYVADPLVPVVLTFQRVLYNVSTYTPPGATTPVPLLPEHSTAWYATFNLAVAGVSALLVLGSLVVFGRLEGNFAEEL
ncbi:MAG TPA: ABC transporter permease [Acidimicrobiales bacterium]|nr:ABC transporter permease [Acidimicrobiales bacterium]